MKHFLFSYGTLEKREVQERLFGRTLSGHRDTLDGYKISTIEIRDDNFLAKGEDKLQKTLVPTGICGDFVEGMVFELTKEEMQKADSYEPRGYQRISVKLESGTKAWIYLANE